MGYYETPSRLVHAPFRSSYSLGSYILEVKGMNIEDFEACFKRVEPPKPKYLADLKKKSDEKECLLEAL